jgi:CheY-like chemotaxis protein
MVSIYIVEDDAEDLMLLKEALENEIKEVEITEFADGKALLDFFNDQHNVEKPALILLDMNMPRVSGLEALVFLKSKPETQHIPVVMISTSSDQRFIRYAYDQGVSAFMVKPVSINNYKFMAETVNVCFLNHCVSMADQPVSSYLTDKSILVIKDNAAQWEVLRYSQNQRLPDVKILPIDDKESTLDFLTGTWKTLSSPPELIMLDLYLPTRREGLNLLDMIRYFFIVNDIAPVPVLVLSTFVNQQDKDATYRHRANAYMIKAEVQNHHDSCLPHICNLWWRAVILPKN